MTTEAPERGPPEPELVSAGTAGKAWHTAMFGRRISMEMPGGEAAGKIDLRGRGRPGLGAANVRRRSKRIISWGQSEAGASCHILASQPIRESRGILDCSWEMTGEMEYLALLFT